MECVILHLYNRTFQKSVYNINYLAYVFNRSDIDNKIILKKFCILIKLEHYKAHDMYALIYIRTSQNGKFLF